MSGPPLNEDGRERPPRPPSIHSRPPSPTTNTLQLHNTSFSPSTPLDRPLRRLPSRFGSPVSDPSTSPSSRMATLSLGPSKGDGQPPTTLFGSSNGGGYIDLRMGEFEGTTRYDGHDDEGFEGEMGGGGDQSWDDGFHPTTTSLPKKRKIPTHPNPSPHSPPPTSNNKALNSSHSNNQNSSPNSNSFANPPPSSEHFTSFPHLPRGYTSRPFTALPRPTPLPFPRASPACRAFLWSKAVWSERKRMLASRLMVEADGGEGWLAPDEEKAVEFGGNVWGKGWEDGGETNVGGVSFAWGRRKKKPVRSAGGVAREGVGAMKGVREMVTKDGLSVTAVVREEMQWFGGKKGKPSKELQDKLFTFESESPAYDFQQHNEEVLQSLRERLHLYTTNYKSVAPAVGDDSDSSTSSPPRSNARKALPPTTKHHPDTYINVGTQTTDEPPRADQPGSGKIVTPRSLASKQSSTTTTKARTGSSTTTRPTTTPRKDSVGAGAAAGTNASAFTVPPPKPKRDDVVESIEPPWEDGDGPAGGTTHKKKTGKKKRSALANAANPHHMKNYVPTRLLSEQPPAPTNPASLLANLLFPPPTRFLSAQPSRYRSSNPPPPSGPDDPPSEEYICVFCDYELFYGTSAEKRKVVEKRKKMLARRRRAKERASGVANGTGAGKKSTTGGKKTGGGKKGGNSRSRGVGGDGDDDALYEEGGVGEEDRRPEGNSMGLNGSGEDDGEEDWDCDEDENGKCRRCSERRDHERKNNRGKRKKGKIRGGGGEGYENLVEAGTQTSEQQ